jgi:hypothetical protein
VGCGNASVVALKRFSRRWWHFLPSSVEERSMKLLFMKVSMAVLTLAGVFAATPVFAGHVLDFRVLGKGSVVSDCILASLADCTIELSGQASGTHIGHDDFNLRLRVTPAGQRLTNGDGVTPFLGLCVVVHGFFTITPPSEDTRIDFRVAGLVCEEGVSGSDAGFNLHYRISGGTARFEGRSGGGSLTGSFRRNRGGVVYLHLNGTIDR